MLFDLTRATALQHLASATPTLGRDYAANRNAEPGPGEPPTTSMLSPYLRRRLILEQEAVAAALDAHGPDRAEKFVSEVFWRTYFKGFLETHPTAWTDYLAQVTAGRNRLATESGLRRIFEDAVAGHSGIECFDDWACTLVETGWLHNHVRMWFASIWIFTLELPWALGADFFLRHLLDGDPASNTLSWRWVAGLHTRGKAYAATAGNIARYTDGRYAPSGLNEHPEPLSEDRPPSLHPLAPAAPAPSGNVALLLHLDDLNPETLPLGNSTVIRISSLLAHAPDAVEMVSVADQTAMTDALTRATAHFGCPATPLAPGWNDGLPIVTAWAPIGPSADALPEHAIRIRRAWDTLAWPHATRGFFAIRKASPEIIRAVG